MVPEKNPLAGVKVMVIDDSNTIRRSAEIFLLQAGCTVILAEDGFDALAKITDHQPDLVFVDIMMPRLDGYQTCALIKKHAKFQGMPVIREGVGIMPVLSDALGRPAFIAALIVIAASACLEAAGTVSLPRWPADLPSGSRASRPS